MKLLKQTLAFACCAVLLLSLFAVCACAATVVPPLDETHICSLTIKAVYNTTPLPGMEFDLYRVGDVSGSDPTFTLTGDFAGMPIDPMTMDTDDWDALAVTLLTCATNLQLNPGWTVTADANGFATQDQLGTGLYLVVGNCIQIQENIYSCKPFLVSLPGFKRGAWDYDPVAVPKISVTSTETIELSVHKIWDDWWDQSYRPGSIKVNLYCDGILFRTAVLNERTSWRATFTNLPAQRNWTITEEYVEHYTVRITRNGNSFTITNRYDGPPPSETPTPPLPQTGLLWWPVYTIAGVGVLLLLFGLVSVKLNRATAQGGNDPESWQDDEKE